VIRLSLSRQSTAVKLVDQAA